MCRQRIRKQQKVQAVAQSAPGCIVHKALPERFWHQIVAQMASRDLVSGVFTQRKTESHNVLIIRRLVHQNAFRVHFAAKFFDAFRLPC